MTLRILQSSVDLLVNTTNSTTDGTPTSDFNPKVFWSINAFIAFLLVATVLGCWYRVYHCGVRFDSNTYRLRVLRAQEAAAEAQKESPEKRKRLLLASFRRHGVTKVLAEDDLIAPEETDVEAAEDEYNTGTIRLDADRTAANCCAVCLAEYEVGERIVWSSNPQCVHVFHVDCCVDWLVKMQPETPCPCCRQEFTDLDRLRKERKIHWRAGATFDPSTIALR